MSKSSLNFTKVIPAGPLVEKVSSLGQTKVRNFWDDFQAFAFQGNLIELAVGVVVGTAFKQVSTSLVDNIIMPPVGMLLGRVNFNELYFNLSGERYASLAAARTAGAPIIAYGVFITDLIDFFLVALSIYVFLRVVFRVRGEKKKEK